MLTNYIKKIKRAKVIPQSAQSIIGSLTEKHNKQARTPKKGNQLKYFDYRE